MSERYDVVVVGAGPAGLSAARAAAGQGARVAIVDDNPRAGGQVWRQGPWHPAQQPLRVLMDDLAPGGRVTWWQSSRVVAPLAGRELLIESEQHGGVRISYDRLILATGARERLLPFSGWTLPGVTGAGGLQALIKGGVPVRGERLVIAGSGPLLLAALATARDAGADVLAVVEQASAWAVAHFALRLMRTPSKLAQATTLTRGFVGLRYWTGSVVHAARGAGRVEQVTIRRGAREVTLACDRVACGYGLEPNVLLGESLGCTVAAHRTSLVLVVDDLQQTSVANVFAAGECTGVGGMELARVEGEIAGLAAVDAAPAARARFADRARWRRFAANVDAAFALGEAARALPPDDTLLCRCEDVTVGAVRAHANWRDAKLQTRCGMGACQGRICATAARTYFGWGTEAGAGTGRAAPRPPLQPTQIATLIEAADS
ncbi:NAD(P)/FAD-dependent oxidoreductase [Paraburkholderia kururiensis]|uniref:FAD/NAD(P)-binding oxidoreductase n=1 Tax=Paraburkholderia kururiensis TaxID=984307 RepID=A0ABZ0WQB2_9BURK|nr:FAD/NAD(P)-binding oxidoreductase [Paraburkholderia kururiensis]WQD79426.1 FAD/NAD(P)-binding oxidoreductase [Paraburkholderia kururiensis]